MKRSLFIAIVVLLMAALFVSCNADKAVEDQLFEVTIDGGARALQATAEFNVDIEQYYWFYTATKTSGGFRTGEKTEETPVKTTAGLRGANLGSFSKGTWQFSFYGYAAAADKGDAAKCVFFQAGLEQTVNSAVSLAVTLERGQGELPAATVVFDNPTWYHADFAILPANQTTGYALDLKVFVGDATEEWKTVSATTVDGKATFQFAATDELTLTEATTLKFRVYWGEDLVGSEDLPIAAAGATKYIVKDLNDLSGIIPVDEKYGVIVFDAIVSGIESTTATGTISVSPQDATVAKAGVAPVATEQTTVTFPAGSFETTDTHELKIEVSDAAAASSFTIQNSGAAIAALSFNLDNATTTTTFGQPVVIETYIQRDLAENSIAVEYVGSYEGTDAQPTDVEYDPATGKLTFKVTHFSDYVIVSTAAVARIGNTLYETLPAAIAAAQNGETVVLLKNASGAGIFLGTADAKTITIDLGGFTYTCSGPAVGSTGTATQALHLEKGNTVTVKNGKITSTATSGVKMLVQNYCDLTLEDVVLDGTNIPGSAQYVLSGNNGDILITGDTDIIAKAGDYAFDVCYTNYYPDGVRYLFDENYKGTVTGTIQFDVWGTKPATLKCGLTIKAGTFDGAIEIQNALKNDNLGINITGGSINGVEAPVALIANGAAYATLKDAVAAAGEGSVIIVLRDVENAEGMSVAEGKNFTVDFGGHTYVVNKPGAGSTGTETAAFQLLKNSSIVMKNGVIRVSNDNLVPATVGKNIMRIIQSYADLTLDGMKIYAENQYGGESLVLSFNNGNVVLKNGTQIITSSNSTVAFDSYNWLPYYPSVSVTIEAGVSVNGKIEIGGGENNILTISKSATVGGVVAESGYTLNSVEENDSVVYTISK